MMLLASNTPQKIIARLAAGLCRKPPRPSPEFPTRSIPSRLRAWLQHRDPEPSPCEVFHPPGPSKIFGSRGSAAYGAARCLCHDPNSCCQKSWRAPPCPSPQHPSAQHRGRTATAPGRRERHSGSCSFSEPFSSFSSTAGPGLGGGWWGSGGRPCSSLGHRLSAHSGAASCGAAGRMRWPPLCSGLDRILSQRWGQKAGRLFTSCRAQQLRL